MSDRCAATGQLLPIAVLIPAWPVRRSRYVWAATIAVWVGAVAAGQWLGRTAGSTQAERRQVLPGDELVDHPTVVTNHAVTIPAPPDRVWPWLVQMGWHRGGWYTAHWGRPAAIPGQLAQRHRTGSRAAAAPGRRRSHSRRATRHRLVRCRARRPTPPASPALHHIPAAWRARLGASIDWASTFTLADAHNGGTRLLLGVRGQTRPWWLTAIVAALVPADDIMALSMLAGISRPPLDHPHNPTGPLLDPSRSTTHPT